MADKENYGGLANAGDLSKVNTYGLDDERLQELHQAQEDAYNALQQRYSQPNWFKVAAGFAKPQLGGFTASLGSAADALGDTVEAQRAQQLPLAEMKMRMAQSNLLLSQNKKASDMVAERRNKGLPITSEFAAEVARIAPDSAVAKALTTEIGTQQKEQELAGQRIALARSMGRDPNPADMALLEKSTAPGSPPNPPGGGQNVQPPAGGNQPPVEQVPTGGKTSSVSNEDFLKATHGLENIPPGQKAKTSSAQGPGGMLDSTRANLQKKYNLPEGYGTDPAVTAQYENALIKDNAETVLKPNKMDETTLNHRMAWWFGPEAPKLTNTDPASKIGEVLSPDTIKANGLDPNMRVGKLVSRIEGNLWDQGINPKHMVGGAQAQQKPTELPLDPADTKPDQKLGFGDWGFANVPTNARENEILRKPYEDLEKQSLERLKGIQENGDPYARAQTTIAPKVGQFLNFIDGNSKEAKENRFAVQSVLNTMHKNPALINAVLASGEAGVHATLAGRSASVGLPVKPFVENFNTPAEQKAAQMIEGLMQNTNGFNKIAFDRSINFTTFVHEMSLLENQLERDKNLYNGYQSLREQYRDKLDPVAPTYQILNSQWANSVVKHHLKKTADYNDSYNKALNSAFKN